MSAGSAYYTPATHLRDGGGGAPTSLLDDISATLRDAGTPAAFVRRLDGQFQDAFRRTKAQLAGSPGSAQASPSARSTRDLPAQPASGSRLQALLADIHHSVSSGGAATPGPAASVPQSSWQGSPASVHGPASFSPSPSFSRGRPGSQPAAGSPLAGLIPGLAAARRTESRREQPAAEAAHTSAASEPAQLPAWARRAAKSPAAAAASQPSSRVSPGALAWKAAAKAWRDRGGAAGGPKGPSPRTKLEALLAEIEQQRRSPPASPRAASRAPSPPRSEAAVSQPAEAPDEALAWETEVAPVRQPEAAAPVSLREQQQAAAAVQEPLRAQQVERRFPAAAEALLARVEAWAAAEAGVRADLAARVRQRLAPLASGA